MDGFKTLKFQALKPNVLKGYEVGFNFLGQLLQWKLEQEKKAKPPDTKYRSNMER